jgi:hypothetical protein
MPYPLQKVTYNPSGNGQKLQQPAQAETIPMLSLFMLYEDPSF